MLRRNCFQLFLHHHHLCTSFVLASKVLCMHK
nr:MAG TPA: hypothetical protein [Caudoviricetes sp.]